MKRFALLIVMLLVAAVNAAQAGGYGYNPYYYGGYWWCHTGSGLQYYTSAGWVPYQQPARVGWKEGLTKLAQDAKENEAFIAALDALGLTGAARQAAVSQYAPAYNPAAYGSYSYTTSYGYGNPAGIPFTQNGNTLYGYQQAAQGYAQQFGNIDTGALLNSALRLGDQAQQMAGQAMTDINDTINNVARGQQQVAQTIAQGAADAQRIQASRPDPQPISRTFQFTPVQPVQSGAPSGISASYSSSGYVTPQQPQQQPAQPQGGVKLLPQVGAILQASCLSCHNQQKASGGLNLANWGSLSLEQYQHVRARIATSDPAMRMPPVSSGLQLNVIEIAVLTQDAATLEAGLAGSGAQKPGPAPQPNPVPPKPGPLAPVPKK